MSKLKIIIADDESLTRMDIREMLEEAGYLVVGEAGNGQQVIQLVRELNPDVVMLDIKMPVLDGIETTKILSDLGYPVLLLTAYSQLSIVERAKKVGALHYLVKPISERDLLPAIEMTYALHQRMLALQAEVRKATAALEERKAIDKACSAYASRLGITNEVAYRRMTRLAMNKNKSLYTVACEILQLLNKQQPTGVEVKQA